MKTVDLFIIGILIFGAVRGYNKGFLMELIALLALILGIIGGFKLIHWGIDILDDYISSEILPFLSFIMIFVGIVILVNILGKLLKEVVHMTPLGSVDSLAGSLLGILKWAFGLSVIIWIFSSFNVSLPADSTNDASIYPLIVSFAPWLADKVAVIFPFLDQAFESIKKQLSMYS